MHGIPAESRKEAGRARSTGDLPARCPLSGAAHCLCGTAAHEPANHLEREPRPAACPGRSPALHPAFRACHAARLPCVFGTLLQRVAHSFAPTARPSQAAAQGTGTDTPKRRRPLLPPPPPHPRSNHFNGIRNSKLLTAPIRSGRVASLEFGIPNSSMIEPPLSTGRRPTCRSGRRSGRRARAVGAAHGFRRTTGAQGSVGPIARPSAGPASCPPDGSGTARSRNGRSGGHEELGRIPARTGTGPSRNVAPPGVPNRPPMSYLRCIAAVRAFRQLVPASRRTGRITSPRDRPGCFRAGCASLRCPQGP